MHSDMWVHHMLEHIHILKPHDLYCISQLITHLLTLWNSTIETRKGWLSFWHAIKVSVWRSRDMSTWHSSRHLGQARHCLVSAIATTLYRPKFLGISQGPTMQEVYSSIHWTELKWNSYDPSSMHGETWCLVLLATALQTQIPWNHALFQGLTLHAGSIP